MSNIDLAPITYPFYKKDPCHIVKVTNETESILVYEDKEISIRDHKSNIEYYHKNMIDATQEEFDNAYIKALENISEKVK
jgi:hypothetical protein